MDCRHTHIRRPSLLKCRRQLWPQGGRQSVSLSHPPFPRSPVGLPWVGVLGGRRLPQRCCALLPFKFLIAPDWSGLRLGQGAVPACLGVLARAFGACLVLGALRVCRCVVGPPLPLACGRVPRAGVPAVPLLGRLSRVVLGASVLGPFPPPRGVLGRRRAPFPVCPRAPPPLCMGVRGLALGARVPVARWVAAWLRVCARVSWARLALGALPLVLPWASPRRDARGWAPRAVLP